MNQDLIDALMRLLSISAKLKMQVDANHAAAVELAKQAKITPEQIDAATSLWSQVPEDPLLSKS